MLSSVRLSSTLCATILAVLVGAPACALAAAHPAGPAMTPTASSAGTGAAAAIDGRPSTAWRAARSGPWWFQVALARATPVAAVRLVGAGSAATVRVQVLGTGARWTTAAVKRLVPGRAVTVDLHGATVRRVALRSSGRTSRRAGVAELTLTAAGRRATDAARQGPNGPTHPASPARSTPPAAAPTTAPSAPTAPAPAGPTAPTGPAPDPTPVDGRFAGVVRNPIDPNYLSCLPFGTRSHWIQPWRAYLDTQPASRLKDAVGINFNPSAAQAPMTARLLAASGFTQARIEIGWGDVSYDDPDRLVNEQDWMTKLQALRDNGIRPLLLLNANDGRPAPAKDISLRVTQAASAGARTVRLDAASAALVRPGYTGFNYTKSAEYLITDVSPAGVATLAKPLPISVGVGTYPAATLAYQPFSPLTRPDGSPNPAGQETLAGWLRYVQTISDTARRVFGAGGFDLEIWNEMNFGSDFLDINNYYQPALVTGTISDDTIMRRTVSWIRDPAHGLDGVRVGNGFASQRPWDGGDSGPVGLDAIDRHFYPPDLHFPADTINNAPKDAQCNAVAQDSNPSYTAFFPEFWLTGIRTETMMRDLAPSVEAIPNLDGGIDHHGRNVAPAGGTPPQLWMTEFGMNPAWAEGDGVAMSAEDEQHFKAKSTLRALSAFVNKGVTRLDFYAANGSEWGLVDPSFYSAAASAGGYPGDSAGGTTMNAVRRLIGALGDDRITVPRQLTLGSIGDYAGRSQFAGNGTSAFPTLYDRDVLAFLPFQASDTRFVVPVYVMTRNLAKVYRRSWAVTRAGSTCPPSAISSPSAAPTVRRPACERSTR